MNKETKSIKTLRHSSLFFQLYVIALLQMGIFSIANGQTLPKEEVDSLHQLILTSSNDSIKGRALNKLGFHYTFNDIEKALPLIEKGLKDAELHKLYFGKAELLNTKATYYDILGEKDSAKYFFEQSLALSRKHKFNSIEVMTLNGMGLYYWKIGKFDEALTQFYKALEINEQFFPDDETSRANYLSNIGLIYQELKRYNKAIEYHEKALLIREKLELINGQAISYANLGVCYKNLEQYDKSEHYFNQAIEKSETAQNWRMYYSLHDNIANIYNLTERNELAIAAYLKALDRPAHVGANPKSDFSTYINLASLYNKLRQANTSMKYAEKGFELLEQYPQLYIFSEGLHYAYAESNYILGNIAEGSKSMLNFRNVQDSIFSEKNTQAMAEMEEKYESAQKDKALLEQQQVIQQKDLVLKNRTIWLISIIGLALFITSILYYRFRQKETAAKQAELELKLAEEKERIRIQEERLRISRELHDNIGSYLTLINASVEQIPDMSPETIAKNLPELQKTLSLSMRELRKTVWLLNNQEISIDAIALRFRDFFKPLNQNGTKITVQADGNTEQTLTDIQATHLFRIVQEAVSNSYKYASSKSIQISLNAQHNNTFKFSITDNGIGFETATVYKGNGLQNMQSRIDELKGQLHIKSEAGKGTIVEGSF